MLTEHFVASVGVPLKPPGQSFAKDAAIFVYEYQPLVAQRVVFKKSATPPNCLAVSKTHVFAAQAEKAVVNVYNREKGNQEAIVPFTERISSIALACEDAVLILGTTEGRIFIWEIATGRQVTTAQSHMQAVTAVVVDPTSNFLLSSSADSTVHIWSIPSILSFTNAPEEPASPLRTFASHRSSVLALVVGHSSSFCNIAVSASDDKTCFIWDYHTNTVLRTYLLPATPTCLSLDAADRAVYIGYDDGDVEQIDLYASGSSHGSSYSAVQNGRDAAAPVQLPRSSKRTAAGSISDATRSLAVCFDSTMVLSGHDSGAVLAWDMAGSRPPSTVLQAPLPGPVNNIHFLPVTGFVTPRRQAFTIPLVVKPKYGAFDSPSRNVPGNYMLNIELCGDTEARAQSDFHRALTAPCFPADMLDRGLNELLSWNKMGSVASGTSANSAEDFMALDNEPEETKQLSLDEQNATLKAELEALRRLQRASFDKIDKLNAERNALLRREQRRQQALRSISDKSAHDADNVESMEYNTSSDD